MTDHARALPGTGYVRPPNAVPVERLPEINAENERRWRAARRDPAVPSSYDYTNIDGKSYVTAVRDQNPTETCAAFSSTAMVEVLARRLLGIPVDDARAFAVPVLSPAEVAFCNPDFDPVKGMDVKYALAYMSAKGVAPESCFPFRTDLKSCELNTDAGKQKTFIIPQEATVYDVDDVRRRISAEGPVVLAIQAYTNFKDWRGGGVYKDVSGSLIGAHALCAVGYDDKKEAWKCKNSWGTGWGDKGYVWLSYSSAALDTHVYHCSVKTAFWFPTIDLSVASTDVGPGVDPAVAVNEEFAVQVHKSEGNNGLWGSTGGLTGAFDPSAKYDETGWFPSITTASFNTVVETHKSHIRSKLFYRAGFVFRHTLDLGGGSHDFQEGFYTAVAANKSLLVVELHQHATTLDLSYRVGWLDWQNKIVNFGGNYWLDKGANPSISINNHGDVVEMHKSPSASRLWGRAGRVDTDALMIHWGTAIDFGQGVNPSVAVNDQNRVMEVHQSDGAMTLWSRTGYLYPDLRLFSLSSARKYTDGHVPRVAMNNRGDVREIHQHPGLLKVSSHWGRMTDGMPSSSTSHGDPAEPVLHRAGASSRAEEQVAGRP